MSSSAAIAIAASSNAAAAAAMQRAKKDECASIEKNYDGTNATVEQKQQYADCIELLYPKEMTESDIIGAKIFIAIGVIGFLFGGVWGIKEDGLLSGAVFAFIAALALPLVALIFYLAACAVRFLFS